MLSIEVTGLLDGLQVLVVEDEPLIGMAVEEAVRGAGGAPVRVETDRAAYAALEAGARALDVIIVDVNLGEGTTGFDVARFARRLDPKLAVIYLSGGPEEWAISFGVDGAVFLAKPVAEAQLLETIARLTGREDRPDNIVPMPL